MKLVVFVAVVLFASAFNVSAQFTKDEIANLKKQTNISSKETVRYSKDARLTSDDSLKIFLAVKRRGSEAEWFEKSIAEWNQKEGDQYGKLEIVDDIREADAILVQFVATNVKRVEEKSIGIGNVPRGQTQPKIRVKSETQYKTLKLPVYSYLMKRDADSWTIIYGNAETSLPDEQFSISPDLRLWQVFKEEMKSR